MEIKSIRFVKRFVLFTKGTRLNSQNQLETFEEQHHVDFGQHHKVIEWVPLSENSVRIEFADADPFSGVATVDKSAVELLSTGEKLINRCCEGRQPK